MDPIPAPKSQLKPGQYDINYGNFKIAIYEEVRREAFGEDIGQNSWLTASEQDRLLHWLSLRTDSRLLDIACGTGGPALRCAERTGCSVTGVDIHEAAISAAAVLSRGREGRAEFRVIDASAELPFPAATFDAITCIDAINHLKDRTRLLTDWVRVLKPGGRILYTDPVIVTGPLSNAEIAQRSSIGFYLFVPTGYNEKLIESCGLKLVAIEDATDNMAEIAERRRIARQKREKSLSEIESREVFEAQQGFLETTSRLARERRLSRTVFIAEK